MARVGLALVVVTAGCDRGRPFDRPAPSTEGPGASVVASASEPIGTAHPTLLAAAADDASWVVLCQARADTSGDGKVEVEVGYHGEVMGDEMRAYLVRGGGEGEPIDALVARSRDGRWVVIERGSGLELVDTRSGGAVALAGADRQRAQQLAPPRAAAFDADSAHVMYFREAAVVVRDLARGDERVISVAPGVPWRVMPGARGPWARLAVLRRDTDGDGRLELPGVRTNAPVGATCSGPAMSYSTYGRTGDEPELSWLRVDTGELVDDPSILAPLAAGFVRRTADGAVVLGSTVLAPPGCAPDRVQVIESPLRVIARCDPRSDTSKTALMGEGLRVPLEFPLLTRDEGHAYIADDELVCPTINGCVDPRDGRPIDMGGWILARAPHVVLTGTWGDEVGVFDLVTRKRTPLGQLGGHSHARAGTFAAIDRTVIDLARARVVGTAPAWPLAIDDRGRALVAAGGEPVFGTALGPLRWVATTP